MKLLVVQTAFLGDVVLTTPLLRELRRAHPDAKVSVLATPVGASVLDGSPFVDERIAWDKKGSGGGALATLRVMSELRAKRFDLAVAAQRSARTGLLLLASGARERIGFAGAAGRLAYNRRVTWDPKLHAVRRYLALAGPAGGRADADPRPEMAVSEASRDRVTGWLRDAGLEEGQRFLAIAPGSVWATKRWRPEGFAEVARAAASRGLLSVLVGGREERELAARIAALADRRVIDLAGRTSIPELAAVLAGAAALVTNDSGPGHVASAVGTPVVAVFGPTASSMGYGPWGSLNRIVELEGLTCRPCSAHGQAACPLGHHRCMNDLPEERVIDALVDVLQRRAE